MILLSLSRAQDLTREKEELTKERDAHLKQIVHVSFSESLKHNDFIHHSHCVDASESCGGQRTHTKSRDRQRNS